jgi:hypothetical protein
LQVTGWLAMALKEVAILFWACQQPPFVVLLLHLLHL